jgi:rRNA maturation protein Nop10
VQSTINCRRLSSHSRACVKSKIVCGTYTLQADRARFNGQKTTSRCPICYKEPEDTKHFLLKCITLNDTRSKFIKKLRDLLELKLLKSLVFELFECDDNLLQLIVDCTKFIKS